MFAGKVHSEVRIHPRFAKHVVSPDYSVELDISAPEVVVKPSSKKERIKNTSRFIREAISQVTARREECKDIWKQYVNKGVFIDD